MTGFSAGGVASSAVFYQARRTLNPTKAYLLNDSGPIFPAPNATYNSWPLHDLIKAQWNLPSLYSQLPASFNPNDFGSINDDGGDRVPERPAGLHGLLERLQLLALLLRALLPGHHQGAGAGEVARPTRRT